MTYSTILEKQLLSLNTCGIYLSNHDIVTMGKELSICLPYKKRTLILQKLFTQAADTKCTDRLMTLLCELFTQRIDEYRMLGNTIKSLRPIVAIWIQKATASKYLIQKELTLHVKDKNA